MKSSVKKLFLALAILSLPLGYFNCTNARLQGPTALSTASISAKPAGAIRPAFAVRGIDCMSCHGLILGNLYTDFGYGDPFYFGKDTPYGSAYKPEHLGSLTIDGDIYVPHRTLPNVNNLNDYFSYYQNATNTKSKYIPLADFFRVRNPSISQVDYNSLGGVQTPGHSGQVYEKEVITIAAPTEEQLAEIIALKTTLLVAKFDDVRLYRASAKDRIEGLELKANDNTFEVYARNDSANNKPITCLGDFIVVGPLFLNNATIITNDKGCRIYATGSIFIQGTVNFAGDNTTTANLQLSSTRAILMGMYSVAMRSKSNSGLHSHYGTDESLLNSAIQADRDRIDSDTNIPQDGSDPRLQRDPNALTDDAGPWRVAHKGFWTWNEGYYLNGSPNLTDWKWTNTPGDSTFSGSEPSFLAYKVVDDDDSSWIYSDIVHPTSQTWSRVDWQYMAGGPGFNPNNFDPKAPAGTPRITSPDSAREWWAEDTTSSQGWATQLYRKSVDYNHLVLNAPKIWSRYYGTFKGMIIAEQVVPAGENTNEQKQFVTFEYDPIFDNTPILPLFGSKLFSVSDLANSTGP